MFDLIPTAVLLLQVIMTTVGAILALAAVCGIIYRLRKFALPHPDLRESTEMLLFYSFAALLGVTLLLSAFSGHPDEGVVDRVNQALLTFVMLAPWLLAAEVALGAVLFAFGAVKRGKLRSN